MMAGKKLLTLVILFIVAGFLYPHTLSAQDCGWNKHNDYICEGGTNKAPKHFEKGPITKVPNIDSPLYTPGGVFKDPGSGVTPPSAGSVECSGGGGYDQFIDHLKQREGVVNCVYRDSLGKPTVGVGHLVLPEDNLSVGDCISDAQVDAFLQKDAQNAWNAAQEQAAEMESAQGTKVDGCTVVALGSVNYQLGTGWRKKFPSTWNKIKTGQYCEAADGLEGSLWNKQTPVRVDDFQESLRNESAAQGKPC